MAKPQFLLRIPEDVWKAFVNKQIRLLEQGKSVQKGEILLNWIRKGIELDKEGEGK